MCIWPVLCVGREITKNGKKGDGIKRIRIMIIINYIFKYTIISIN